MSNPTDKPTVQEEGDESMLFVDGFSIIDDINANGKSAEAAKDDSDARTSPGKDTTVDKPAEDSNSKEVENTEDEKSSNIDASKENEPEISDQSDAKETSALVISNDEDLGSESLISNAETNDQVEVKKEQENAKTVATKAPLKKKNAESSFVWISNITKQVKASSLKKHFSECGKVSTAKVVTNGKVFFGYVEFENGEYASKCVKTMNNTILNGKKILVSRNRPDVTKKPAPSSARKPVKTNDSVAKKDDKPKSEEKPKVEPKTSSDEKKSKEDKEKKKVDTKSAKEIKPEDNKKSKEDSKKPPNEDNKKTDAKKKPVDDKKKDKKESQPTKVDNDLRMKLNDSRKRMERMRVDIERSQIEIRNLRRRLGNEQKKCEEEIKRGEKYRLEVRSLTDLLKQTRSDFEKEMHRVTKKHKLELEKAEYHRSALVIQKEELKSRQENLDREYKKLEEAKKMFHHMKRSRKSRSPSPPAKRFREREGMFSGHRSPPPPPKLSSEGRSKGAQDRPMPFYEDKKSRAVYDRLGDYGEKSFPKDANGSSSSRHRSAYPGDVVVGISKSPWSSQQPVETWKKPNTSSTFLKPFMERYTNTHAEYQAASTSYYPSEHSDYSKHGHFDNSRKY